MTTNQKDAAKLATRMGWDTDLAIEFAIALLTECNLHTEAEALSIAHEQKEKDDVAMLDKLARLDAV